jgi:hypothetical protein
MDNEIAKLLWVNWATSHRHTICVSSHVDYLRFYYFYSRRFQTKQRDILKTIFHQHTFMNAVWPLVVLLPNFKTALAICCGECERRRQRIGSLQGRSPRANRSKSKASLKRSRSDESSKPASRTKATAAAAAKHHVAQQRAPTASPVASAAAGEAIPGKDLKQPWHVPRPGATQPTLPVRSPAESPRLAAANPKLRANKVLAHHMSCVLMWCC